MPCLKHPNGKTFSEKTRTGSTVERCGKCRSERTSKSRKEQIKKLKTHFGGKCTQCGYSKYLECLDFHHLDPSKKEFRLSDNRSGRSFARMLEEAKKCVLLCCLCHREFHIENT